MNLKGWEFRFNWGFTSAVYRKDNWYIMVDRETQRVLLGWTAQNKEE